MKNTKVLILYSGGADSTLLIHLALEANLKPYCVLIDYDQNQKMELDFAHKYLNEKSIPSQTVKLYNLGLHSALTTGEKCLYDGVSDMYVPSRNLMFVSIAASIAENLGIDMIWYGANLSDVGNGFPDCTLSWVKQVNQLLKINGSVEIQLEAPLLMMDYTTDDVMNMLEERGVKSSQLYSGYLEDNKYKVVDLAFLGGRKLPKIDASDIVGTSFADDDRKVDE